MTRYDAQMPDVIDAEAWAAIRAASEAECLHDPATVVDTLNEDGAE